MLGLLMFYGFLFHLSSVKQISNALILLKINLKAKIF
nr:MAG TPA: hypothetical protein [Caudoviricetes sp.]